MLRREAVLVLREIWECIPDECAVNSVFLERAKKSTSFRNRQYDLHMKMAVDKSTFERIVSVTRRHGLSVEESGGNLVVSAAKELVAIMA